MVMIMHVNHQCQSITCCMNSRFCWVKMTWNLQCQSITCCMHSKFCWVKVTLNWVCWEFAQSQSTPSGSSSPSHSSHFDPAELRVCVHDFSSFQSDTLPKVMAGHHVGSKVIGRKSLHIPCSRSILLRGMLRMYSKCTYTMLKLHQRWRYNQNLMLSSLRGNHAVWETVYTMKGTLFGPYE